MSNDSKVSARPPEKKEISFEKLEDLSATFIKEGSFVNRHQTEEKKIHIYPWEEARDDVYKTFNLRLPEEYAIKLDYVAMKTKRSKHAICMDVVKKEVDRILDAVIKKVDR